MRIIAGTLGGRRITGTARARRRDQRATGSARRCSAALESIAGGRRRPRRARCLRRIGSDGPRGAQSRVRDTRRSSSGTAPRSPRCKPTSTRSVSSRIPRCVNGDASRIAARGAVPGEPFGLLILDPPYRIENAEVREAHRFTRTRIAPLLSAVCSSGSTTARRPSIAGVRWRSLGSKTYGTTAVSVYEADTEQ